MFRAVPVDADDDRPVQPSLADPNHRYFPVSSAFSCWTRFLRSMPFPDRWAPFFEPTMRLNDVYAYPTKHFDFHARQLRL